MKKALFSLMILCLIFGPVTTSSAAKMSPDVTFTVTSIREAYGMETDFDAILLSPDYKYSTAAFYVQCNGDPSVTLTITHSNPQFIYDYISQMQCGSVYNVNATFTPQTSGIVNDYVTFSGKFGTITKKIIGNGVPTETPQYWIANLGIGTSVRRLIYDDQRELIYITDAGNNKIIVFSPSQQQVVNNISIGKTPVGLALTPDNQKLYVVNSGEASISVINLNTQVEIDRIDVSNANFSPYEIAIVSDKLALIGGATIGLTSGPLHQLDLDTKQVTLRPDTKNLIVGMYPVMRTSRDFSATGLLLEPGSSPTQLARYDKSSNSVIDTRQGLERSIAINNNGTRLITTQHICNTILPDLDIFNSELTLLKKTNLIGCQPLSIIINPVNPNYVYTLDGRESAIVDIANIELGIQTKRLNFSPPSGYYPHDSHALTISGDGTWIFALLVQTWDEPPSKLLAIKVAPTTYSDSTAPESNMVPLPPTQSYRGWDVSWNGTDDLSGIEYFEVEYRIGQNGPWTAWAKTTSTSAYFTPATPGQTYYFRTIAHDRAGNIEPYSNTFDAFTHTIDDSRKIFVPFINE